MAIDNDLAISADPHAAKYTACLSTSSLAIAEDSCRCQSGSDRLAGVGLHRLLLENKIEWGRVATDARYGDAHVVSSADVAGAVDVQCCPGKVAGLSTRQEHSSCRDLLWRHPLLHGEAVCNAFLSALGGGELL